MPFMTEEELRKTYFQRSGTTYSLEHGSSCFDFQVLGESQEDGQRKIDVLLVALKTDLVDQHIATLKAAGLTPTIIDVDAFALQNIYEINRLESNEETVALINVGATWTTINILEGVIYSIYS
jgi:type IV pilus assembly protein PilM